MKVRIERRPPVVEITSPVDGAVVGGRVVRVAGTVKGAAATEPSAALPPVIVEVNGQPATVEGDRFRADVPLAAVRKTLELRATALSGAGLRSTVMSTVRVDASAPKVSVEVPQPGTVARDSSLTVRGDVDDAAATVLVNGIRATVQKGGFTATVPLPQEGVQRVLVTAADPVGNRREVSIPVRVDRTAPKLRVLNLAENASVDGRGLSLVGMVEDGSAVSISVGGAPAERLERGWQLRLPRLQPGVHALELVARDEAGNQTTLTRTVTVREPAGPTVIEPSGDLLGSAATLSASTLVSASTLAMSAQTLAGEASAGEGVVVGQVLSDVTGLPIAAATVRLSPAGQTTTTDESGAVPFHGADRPRDPQRREGGTDDARSVR